MDNSDFPPNARGAVYLPGKYIMRYHGVPWTAQILRDPVDRILIAGSSGPILNCQGSTSPHHSKKTARVPKKGDRLWDTLEEGLLKTNNVC